MIGRLLKSLALAGTLWLAGCADQFVPESEWPEASPAIWEVSNAQGEKGWLFGTVHALPPDLIWGTPMLDDAFSQSGVLVVEVTNLDAEYGQTLIETLSRTPGQPPLSTRVEPAERDELRALMQAADMDDDDFTDIETWAAALTLSGAVRTGDPRNGVDRAMIAAADEIVGLESYGRQMNMFDTLSEAAQSDLLYGVARVHAQGGSDAMLSAWVSGDAETMGEHVNSALDFSPELRRVLLTDRNRRWTAQISALIDEGRAPFVAVGTGHLVGSESVVEMLGEQGFTVRRIQ
ncbi:TraB/GumN family protein [Aurantiacibacter sp. MUD11]|uniref:TraB/GumN family protein n=1 Tax=Aurantiacibacter sp. MUD11 TaxID=3003265 RepID=UPI0022AABF7A|nr:TraB/GumN family protein [Aurantiacibacter sp. MUD11]WAT18401.1 TraB/GumN family protein [Aurantiacibacter sp. MUD11]